MLHNTFQTRKHKKPIIYFSHEIILKLTYLSINFDAGEPCYLVSFNEDNYFFQILLRIIGKCSRYLNFSFLHIKFYYCF